MMGTRTESKRPCLACLTLDPDAGVEGALACCCLDSADCLSLLFVFVCVCLCLGSHLLFFHLTVSVLLFNTLFVVLLDWFNAFVLYHIDTTPCCFLVVLQADFAFPFPPELYGNGSGHTAHLVMVQVDSGFVIFFYFFFLISWRRHLFLSPVGSFKPGLGGWGGKGNPGRAICMCSMVGRMVTGEESKRVRGLRLQCNASCPQVYWTGR
ncbi:hypothetical protein VTK56DRAFT_9067 [Thermocarpiscus australiensis]